MTYTDALIVCVLGRFVAARRDYDRKAVTADPIPALLATLEGGAA